MEIKVPRRFFDDHIDRDLEAPAVLRETKKHYFIDGDSEHLAELLNDADYYASDGAPDWDGGVGIRASARVTAAAIRAALAR